MSTPQSGAQRLAAHRAARRASGLKEVRNLWCHPDDEPQLRALAAELTEARRRRAAAATPPPSRRTAA